MLANKHYLADSCSGIAGRVHFFASERCRKAAAMPCHPCFHLPRPGLKFAILGWMNFSM